MCTIQGWNHYIVLLECNIKPSFKVSTQLKWSYLGPVRFAICDDNDVIWHIAAVAFVTLKHHLPYVPAIQTIFTYPIVIG